jgi:hypothetical protein
LETGKVQDGHLKELWDKQNDSVYIGQSYFIKIKTLSILKNSIRTKKEIFLTYTTIIKGQNNDKTYIVMLIDHQRKQSCI